MGCVGQGLSSVPLFCFFHFGSIFVLWVSLGRRFGSFDFLLEIQVGQTIYLSVVLLVEVCDLLKVLQKLLELIDLLIRAIPTAEFQVCLLELKKSVLLARKLFIQLKMYIFEMEGKGKSCDKKIPGFPGHCYVAKNGLIYLISDSSPWL